ncbi:hypothetical protein K3495_g2527 [Podosphaera aphanis]|nr:hypothetical protein K3495_g2527 [Podosphaera aphanis]
MTMATTKVVFNRAAGGVEDLFEPVMLRERAYLRSIAHGKSATADVNIFDGEDEVNENNKAKEGKFGWERYNKKKQS